MVMKPLSSVTAKGVPLSILIPQKTEDYLGSGNEVVHLIPGIICNDVKEIARECVTEKVSFCILLKLCLYSSSIRTS